MERKMTTKPIKKQKKSILLLAWLAPIIAIFISYHLLEGYIAKKGDIITIYTKDIKGLNVAKSHIIYQGLEIGKLLDMTIDQKDINRFKITAQIYKQYNYFIKKGSLFWIVAPTINITKVKNLDTILIGNYIEIQPITTDIKKLSKLSYQNTFIAREHPPYKNGKKLIKIAKNIDISVDTLINYKGIDVGKVLSKELLKNDTLEYKLLIYEKYKNLVNKDTLFYQNIPVSLDISPTDISFKIESVKELLSSSISFINDATIKDKNSTIIYSSKEKLYFNDNDIVLNIKGNELFKKVYYKGEVVAKVIKTIYNEKNNSSKIYIRFKSKYSYLLKTEPKFYIKSAKLDIKKLNFKDMISGDRLILLNNFNARTPIQKIYNVKKYNPEDFQKGLSLIFDSEDVNIGEKILYKNIEVGYIKKIYIHNFKREAIGFIYDRYKKLINNNTQFYKLQDLDVDISMQGIDLSIGSFKQMYQGGISFIVDNTIDNKFTKKSFKIFKNIKTLNKTHPKKGLRVVVVSEDSKNISMNAPVYYKYFQIGYIESIKLNTITNKIETTVFIESKYKKYITNSTKFYLNSVVDIEFGLFNSKINIGNLTSLIKGGFSIKEQKEFKSYAKDNQKYTLAIEKKD